MRTYTNDQAQETLARIKGDRAVTREALFKFVMHTLGDKYIKCPGDRLRRVDEIYHKIFRMDFTYRDDLQELVLRLIKRRDWKSIYKIMSWAASPESSPFNHN